MKINWKVRIHNPTWWLCAIGSIVMPIIAYFGLSLESFTSWDMVIETFIKAVSNPYIVFMSLFSFYNSLVDPTTRGLSDSSQAMEYKRPLKDYEKIDVSKYIDKGDK